MIEKIDHIGIAVKSLEKHLPFYTKILGLELIGKEEIEDQKVKVAMIKVGNVKIELLEPTVDDSPIAKFIDKRGEGMHHIAYHSNDIKKEIKNLKENDIRMIDKKPREGAHGTKIAFVHPKSSGKVLTEICENE
ncbi:MAG: methylmalonyl-CoA epimerase [Candidatus Mcinerneyibacterium aminivorans]|jgi:methylmalonyl-CoA/ethylmalonyl-CoA epimerase|uniref:Methylmalonyl-CoA epimerase n=1 Tax=Candidatus Mcinerneyibacterium aminivorans TaxID=2703815 RepID=A0A5D0MJX4_9BACT|nr:MAG: methylmalonyl-CoA epimerase [Candidatus Mcinerneyibacterium aminivorans]